MRRLVTALAVVGLGAAACASDPTGSGAALDPAVVADADTRGVELTLVTHASFSVSEGVWDTFEGQTGIKVTVTGAGDAGEVVARAVLTAGEPEGDVLFGIDNTFLSRGLDADIFVPYESPALSSVPQELRLDPGNRVTPIDYGDVCVNWWDEAFADGGPPMSLDDLTEPRFAATFVTEHPETSSPGFAFLLATVARYGDGGWQDYWRKLRAGGVTVSAGWEDAYYGDFRAGGTGDKALVTSYATSPVAEVVFADPPVDRAPTGVLTDGCFRQVEFAGILAGTTHPEAAAKLVDFLLSPTFQDDIPLNMFVYPVSDEATLPAVFVEHGVQVTDSMTLDPAEIEANRAAWTDEWVELVLR